MKRTFSTELAYVFGIVFVARGVVLMERPTSAFPWWSRLHTFFTVGCLPCGASSPSAWRNTACRLCALINGYVIGRFSAFYEEHWTFCDRFPWRKYFAPDTATQTNAE